MTRLACLWLLGVVAALPARAGGLLPAPDHTRETAAIARGFMHLQYDLKDLKGAKATYYSPDFIQHNPEIGNGVHGDVDFIAARQQREPDKYLPVGQWTNVIDHVLVQDKLFAIHHHVFTHPGDPGRVFMDIWRVENGKMVEHWDIIQPTYPDPLNDNTMWSSLVKARAPRRGEPSPEAVIREYLRLGLQDGNASGAAERYVADSCIQHSPHIPAGKRALVDYFRKREIASDPAAPKPINSVSHIIADGDLVLVTRHAMLSPDDPGSMAADLFRIQAGLIVEHWDVKQDVPATSINGNKMW